MIEEHKNSMIIEYDNKRKKQRDKAIELLESGVYFQNIDNVYIDDSVSVGKNTFIGANVTLSGNTIIGEDSKILGNTRIENSKIGDKVTVDNAVILDAEVGDETSIGPFAYIRPKSVIGKNCKVGDFVEIKNSTLGDGTKSSHLTYIGDSDLGKNINLGCGVVFVNYDGTNKHRSVIEDSVFVGCNSNIISPVKIEEGAYIAAGTTIHEDVPKFSLSIGRKKQENKPGWAKEKGLYKK